MSEEQGETNMVQIDREHPNYKHQVHLDSPT